MHVRTFAASGVLLASCWVVAGTAAPALAVCDAYSATCPTEAPTDTGPDTETDTDSSGTSGTSGGGDEVANPSTLPFTGGEVVLLTAVGAGALAGGTALVVAGRRKNAPQP